MSRRVVVASVAAVAEIIETATVTAAAPEAVMLPDASIADTLKDKAESGFAQICADR